jgi:hypothetical protein
MNGQSDTSTDVTYDENDDEKDDDQATATAVLREKLIDVLIPGYQVEFDPEEAEKAGAFVEDALSEQDAADSDIDLVDATVPVAASDRE